MIILKKLRWDNCFSYGQDNYLNLNDSNLTQLVGTNGQGKSSIPLIIEEVLFNKNSKGIKKQEIQNQLFSYTLLSTIVNRESITFKDIIIRGIEIKL